MLNDEVKIATAINWSFVNRINDLNNLLAFSNNFHILQKQPYLHIHEDKDDKWAASTISSRWQTRFSYCKLPSPERVAPWGLTHIWVLHSRQQDVRNHGVRSYLFSCSPLHCGLVLLKGRESSWWLVSTLQSQRMRVISTNKKKKSRKLHLPLCVSFPCVRLEMPFSFIAGSAHQLDSPQSHCIQGGEVYSPEAWGQEQQQGWSPYFPLLHVSTIFIIWPLCKLKKKKKNVHWVGLAMLMLLLGQSHLASWL